MLEKKDKPSQVDSEKARSQRAFYFAGPAGFEPASAGVKVANLRFAEPLPHCPLFY